MAISADQIAVLEMLLSGDQNYADLDDLFGLDKGETRNRAGAALEEIGGADPDANVGLTDYILGQADPIGRADAIRHLRQNQVDHDLATTISDELVALFPDADVPTLPAPPGSSGRKQGKPAAAASTAVSKPGRPAGEPKSVPSGESRFSIPEGRGRLYGMLGGGGLVLIIVVLAIAGVFGGGDDDPATSEEGTAPTAQGTDELSTALPDGQELTRVPLAPTGNGDAAGAAVVGVTDSDQPYLDLTIAKFEPPTGDQIYILWFMFNENEGYPLATDTPIDPQNGKFEGRFPIPVESAEIVSRAVRIEVSLTTRESLEKPIQDAIKDNQPTITRPGTTVLSGDVPQPNDGGQQDQVAPGEGEGE